MNKVEAYPWIGVAIGVLIGIILSINISPSDSYIVLNTIVFGVTIGCIYSYIAPPEEMSERRGAIITCGIVGGLFGLHPVSLCIFVFAGAYMVLTFKGNLGLYLIFCPIVGAIMGFFAFNFDPIPGSNPPDVPVAVVGFAIIGLIPLLNTLLGLVWGGIIGYGINESIEVAPPLFSIPLITVVGYALGNTVKKIAIRRAKITEDTEHSISWSIKKIKRAKMLGFDDSKSENIIKDASEQFRVGKYKIAKELAGKAEKLAGEYLQKHNDYLQKHDDATAAATAAIGKAREAIDSAKCFGCNSVGRAKELLDKAISTVGSASEQDNTERLKEGGNLANEAQKVAKQIKTESKPEIDLTLYAEKEFRPQSWQSVTLEVTNVGGAHAKDIEIRFSKEAEVKDLKGINTLDRGESKELEFMLNPVYTGKVPVDIGVRFRDLDGTAYTFGERFYLDVMHGVSEVSVKGDYVAGGKQVAGGDIVTGTKIVGDVVATRSTIGSGEEAFKNCPYCGETLNLTKTTKFCPHCGAEIEQGE